MAAEEHGAYAFTQHSAVPKFIERPAGLLRQQHHIVETLQGHLIACLHTHDQCIVEAPVLNHLCGNEHGIGTGAARGIEGIFLPTALQVVDDVTG